MKIYSLLASTLLFLLCSSVAFAQTPERVKRRAKNRAEQRTNQRVDQKVDEAVDKVFDDLFGKKKKKSEEDEEADPAEAEDNKPGTSIFDRIGGSDEAWEPVRNDYPMSFRMVTTTTKNNKSEDMILEISLGEWKTGYRIIDPDGKQGTMRIILDNQEGTMTTITQEDGEEPRGMQMSQRMVNRGSVTAKMEEKMDEYSFEKTGRTKVIDGYNCEEYAIQGPDGSGTSWITNDIDMEWQKVISSFAIGAQGQQSLPGLEAPYQGFPIESAWTDDKGKETTVAQYKDIRLGDDIDRSLLETGDIPIQKIGF